MDFTYENKYYKYKTKYLKLKMLMQFGGDEELENQTKINSVMRYARSLLGIPYRWHIAGDKIKGNDKFWAENGPKIEKKDIKIKDLCIVCSGLTNLMRRYLGLGIPGLGSLEFADDDKLHGLNWRDLGDEFPGTTGIWFHYLSIKGRLLPFNIYSKYPIGTMLLQNYENDERQGHVAIVYSSEGENILSQKIIHATAWIGYAESKEKNLKNVGAVVVQTFDDIKKEGWFNVTHVCLPENWLLKN